MTNFFLACCLWICCSPLCQGQIQLTPSNDKGSVKFQIKNFGLTVDGSFEGIAGKILWDDVAVENSSFDISLDASTVNTGITLRDKHVRKKDYLDVTTHPFIRFESTKVSLTKVPRMFEAEGKLTIKGTIKTISFPFSVSDQHIFSGQFAINRKDYGVGASSLSLGDLVIVFLSIRTTKTTPGAN